RAARARRRAGQAGDSDREGIPAAPGRRCPSPPRKRSRRREGRAARHASLIGSVLTRALGDKRAGCGERQAGKRRLGVAGLPLAARRNPLARLQPLGGFPESKGGIRGAQGKLSPSKMSGIAVLMSVCTAVGVAKMNTYPRLETAARRE